MKLLIQLFIVLFVFGCSQEQEPTTQATSSEMSSEAVPEEPVQPSPEMSSETVPEPVTSPPEVTPEPVPSISGSGYADLEGTVINYSYVGFDTFHFAIHDNKIRWHGQERYFKGIVREVIPQISRVADNVYFTSWQTMGNGGDNVVHNFNTMEVNAHLNPSDDTIKTLEMITGPILCWSATECIPPAEAITPDAEMMNLIGQNSSTMDLPALFDPEKNNVARSEADMIAREELAGLAIRFDTPYGTTRIEVDGDETRVSENGGEAESHITFATRIAEDVYFISWLGDLGGNHIIVNRDWGKVFDHISPTGDRKEMIYELTCLDTASDC